MFLVSKVCSCLVLSSNQVCWIYYRLFISSPDDSRLGCFRVCAIMNKAAVKFTYSSSCRYSVFYFFLVHISEWTRWAIPLHIVTTFFLKTAKIFSKVAVPFVFIPATYESCDCSTSLPTHDTINLFKFCHFSRCVVVSYCGFYIHAPICQ